MEEIVKVAHLQKRFGKFQALKDVSFTVEKAKWLGLSGLMEQGSPRRFGRFWALSKKIVARRRSLIKTYGKTVSQFTRNFPVRAWGCGLVGESDRWEKSSIFL